MATYQPYNEYSTVTGGGFDSSQNSNKAPNSAGSNSSSTLTPVTIKQITESKQLVQDGPFVIHNLELHHVSFVGVVRNVIDHTASINLTIEDGTGQIEVRKWSDDSGDIANASQPDENTNEGNQNYNSQVAQLYQVGTYVKVFGALREFSGKKNVQYAVIKPVDSFNDVIAHHLAAIKCHAIANGKIQSETQHGDKAFGQDQQQSLFVQDTSDGEPKTALQRILEFCKQQCKNKDANNFAVHTKLIAQSLGMIEDDVRMYCQTLTEQGFIYPTFDDCSYFVL